MSGLRAFISLLAVGFCAAAAGGSALAQPSGNSELIKICSKKKPQYCEYGTGGDIMEGAYYSLVQSCGMKLFRMADWTVRSVRVDEQPVEQCPIAPLAAGGGKEAPRPEVAPQAESSCPAKSAPPGSEQERCENVAVYGSATVGLGILPYVIPAFAKLHKYDASVESHRRHVGGADAVTVYSLQSQSPDRACLKLTVSSGLSKGGVEKFIAGQVDIAMSSGPLSDDELDQINRRLQNKPRMRQEIEHVVGLDALSLVVHPRNKVDALGFCDAAKIFEGARTNWSKFGGADAPVNPRYRRDQAASYKQFRDLSVQHCNIEPHVMGENLFGNFKELTEKLAADAEGLGVVPRAFADGSEKVKTLRLKDTCGMELHATPFNVSTEDYVLTRKLYVMTAADLPCIAERLVRFMEADNGAGKALAEGNSLLSAEDTEGRAIGVNIAVQPVDARSRDGTAPETAEDRKSWEQFQKDLASAARLSSTFRFKPSLAELDERGVSEALRLAAYLRDLATARDAIPRTLILAGFADGDGSIDACRRTALERAQNVREKLKELGVHRYVKEILIKGYGKILPLACNDKDIGKEKNRRVEAYLTPPPR